MEQIRLIQCMERLTVGDSLFAVLGVAAVRKEVLMSVSGFTIDISRYIHVYTHTHTHTHTNL